MWDATLYPNVDIMQELNFNPRIPMWDATYTMDMQIEKNPLFQSTHPNVGCDVRTGQLFCAEQFQSTHPNVGCDK